MNGQNAPHEKHYRTSTFGVSITDRISLKNDRSLRACIDYRKLNSVSVKNTPAIPRTAESLNTLRDACILSTIDAGFWYSQMEINYWDKDKTTFTSQYDLYRFLQIPFSLKRAPSMFQPTMYAIMSMMRWQFTPVYIHDVSIFSRPVEEHFDHYGMYWVFCQDPACRWNWKFSSSPRTVSIISVTSYGLADLVYLQKRSVLFADYNTLRTWLN